MALKRRGASSPWSSSRSTSPAGGDVNGMPGAYMVAGGVQGSYPHVGVTTPPDPGAGVAGLGIVEAVAGCVSAPPDYRGPAMETNSM
jgi:hypothetical protein